MFWGMIPDFHCVCIRTFSIHLLQLLHFRGRCPGSGILLSVPLLVVDATRMRVLLATRMRVLLVTRIRVPLVTLMIDVDATLTHDVITIYDSHYYSQIKS